MVFFDECAFSSDELIIVCEAFATQDSEFVTDTDTSFNPDTLKRKCPTQLVYASSQDDMSKRFYTLYKQFSKQMFAGNRNYVVVDMICDTAIEVYMDGKPYKPLLTREKVETALKTNRDKAMREYYNMPTKDGGINQIIKWGTIRRNENFYLPQLCHKPNTLIALAFDPARINDNSILTAMRIRNDNLLGYIGEIVNCANFVDSASKKGYKLDSNRQLEELRKSLLTYNGNHNDYVNISTLLIDQGAGGGGTSTYADNLLNDWTDENGRQHRGLIDKTHELYVGYEDRYPYALDKLRLINPKKYRNQMVKEFIELFDAGYIKLPFEFKQEFIAIPRKEENGEETFESYQLTDDEMVALANIDLLKTETTSIYKYESNDKTSITYALGSETTIKTDDRFYTIIMLAHHLHELRRTQIVGVEDEEEEIDLSSVGYCCSEITF